MDQPEIDLTLQDIVQGSEYSRKMVIKSDNPHYDGKTISYRALNGEEFAKAMKNANLTGNDDPAQSFAFLIEAGKMGITTPNIGQKFGKLPVEIITEVGSKILGVSRPTEAAVKDFLTAQKGSSSP